MLYAAYHRYSSANAGRVYAARWRGRDDDAFGLFTLAGWLIEIDFFVIARPSFTLCARILTADTAAAARTMRITLASQSRRPKSRLGCLIFSDTFDDMSDADARIIAMALQHTMLYARLVKMRISLLLNF